MVSELSDADSNFLTSDNPVVISSPHEGHIIPFDPDNVLMMPLNHKFILYLMPTSDISKDNYIARHAKSGSLCTMEALQSNFLQYRNCERFVFGKKRTIKKLVDQKEKLDKVPQKEEKSTSYQEVIERCKKHGLI